MEFLTIKETAHLLRVSPITVRRYIASGKLAAERVGRGIRVRREAIEEFVAPVMPRTSGQGAFCWPRGNGEPGTDVAGAVEVEGVVELPTVLEALGVSAGIFRTGQPTNIAEHKDEYLAEAFEFKG